MAKKDKVIAAVQGKVVERQLALDVKTAINEEDRTVSFILISENNDGERYDWWKEEVYIERLDVNGAKYERLRTFFKDHVATVDSAIGRIENIRIEDGELKADVIFGTDAESEKIFRKYCEGVLTDCSIRYKINTVTVEERKDEPNIVTITDFDIRELSAVGIGFDSGATVGRNIENLKGDFMNEELKKELDTLRSKVDGLTATEEARKKELEEEEKRTQSNVSTSSNDDKSETARAAEIMGLVGSGKIDAVRGEEFITGNTAIEEVYRSIVKEEVRTSAPIVAVQGRPGEENLRNAIENAMAARSGIIVSNPDDLTQRFMGASLLDMAREYCGLNTYNKHDIAQRAMASGDFPILLGNIANKTLATSYEEEASTFEKFTLAVDVDNFKEQTEARLTGTGGRLSKLKEKGEKKNKELGEASEKWKVESYGEKFVFSREMIINDDLNAFSNMLMQFAQMAKRTSNGVVYDLLQTKADFANFAMADGKAIFHADHNNFSSTGTSLSSDTLSAGRLKMSRQTEDEKALNINPKFLIVSPENEAIAKKILSSDADVGSSNSGEFNPHKNMYDLIVDSELDANPWFLAAMNQIKVGYLKGAGRKPIVQHTVSGLTEHVFEGVFDFGVGVMNHRGLYKNNGANS